MAANLKEIFIKPIRAPTKVTERKGRHSQISLVSGSNFIVHKITRDEACFTNNFILITHYQLKTIANDLKPFQLSSCPQIALKQKKMRNYINSSHFKGQRMKNTQSVHLLVKAVERRWVKL